jgi:hypothetical protein
LFGCKQQKQTLVTLNEEEMYLKAVSWLMKWVEKTKALTLAGAAEENQGDKH